MVFGHKIIMEKQKTKLIKILILLPCLWLIGQITVAANLYPYPATGSYTTGQSFSVAIYVSSADQELNAASGIISFPKDKLEVTSLSKNGSIISLWAQEPQFSNTAGSINFEGIILNPGYQGTAGKILTINFKAKVSGEAPLTFISGSILANDGQGTNILSSLGSALYAIEVPLSGPAAEQGESKAVIVGTPPAPLVTSVTHPYSDSWYKSTEPEFSWNLPTGTESVHLLVSKSPQVTPIVAYTPAINYKKLDSLDNGIWYFHVQLKNQNGWGGVTHFRFQIDNQSPDYFNIELQPEDDTTEPVRSFNFSAHDAISGIQSYEIQIDGGETLTWDDDGSHLYKTPILPPGHHTAVFKALDGAENFLVQTAEFVIDPLATPVINEYPKILSSDEPLIIKGQSYPDSEIIIWLQREAAEPQSFRAETDENGSFVFLPDEKLRNGIYTMWAETVDQRGAKSLPTEKYTILIQPTMFWQIGNWTISFLSIIIPLIALIFFLVALVWRIWRQLNNLRTRVKKEANEVHKTFHKEITTLKRLAQKNTKLMGKFLTKEKLTKKEKETLHKLKEDMEQAIKKVDKEIEDVNRQVE